MKIKILDKGLHGVKSIKISLEKSNEVDANIWMDEIKKEIKDKDFEGDEIIINYFIEIEKNLKFDFYQLIRFKKSFEKFLKKEIRTRSVVFRPKNEIKLELSSSKIVEFQCKDFRFEPLRYEEFNHLILIFDVGNDFFNSLKIENKKIIFEGGDYEIGFKKPILIDKIANINSWNFSKDLILSIFKIKIIK